MSRSFTPRSTYNGSFRKRLSRQSLAMVLTTQKQSRENTPKRIKKQQKTQSNPSYNKQTQKWLDATLVPPHKTD